VQRQGLKRGQLPVPEQSREGSGGLPEGYIVVAKNTDSATQTQIPEVGDDETAVFVPANVLDRLADLARWQPRSPRQSSIICSPRPSAARSSWSRSSATSHTGKLREGAG
jgi:hypothetical protein